MKRTFLIIIILSVAAPAAGFWLFKGFSVPGIANINPQSQCQVQEMTFYYLEQCGWCQKVKNEGTIDKIEALGIKVNKINAAVGPISHKFQAVPTFVIGSKVYTGYKTFEELKDLLGCSEIAEQPPAGQIQEQNLYQVDFIGEKGEKVILENGEIRLPVLSFNNNQTRFYNVLMPSGKTIYFFALKDRQGIYRAAANACQVCYGTGKGFRQEGDEIVCNNCGNRYPIEKIATEKGGCNPGPINPDLPVEDGQIIIKQSELEEVAALF